MIKIKDFNIVVGGDLEDLGLDLIYLCSTFHEIGLIDKITPIMKPKIREIFKELGVVFEKLNNLNNQCNQEFLKQLEEEE